MTVTAEAIRTQALELITICEKVGRPLPHYGLTMEEYLILKADLGRGEHLYTLYGLPITIDGRYVDPELDVP